MQGCINDVQGSRWARLCATCFNQKHVERTMYVGRRSALLSNKSAVARTSRSRRQLQRSLDQARWDGARRLTRRRNLLKVIFADCFQKVLPVSVRESLIGIAWLHGLCRNLDRAREKANPTCSSSGCRKQARSLRAKSCTACFEKNSIVAGRKGGVRKKDSSRLLLDFQAHMRWAASNLDVLRSRSGTGFKEKLRQSTPEETRIYNWLSLHASDLEPSSLLAQQLAIVDTMVTKSEAA